MKSNQKNLLPLFASLFIAAIALLSSCKKDPEEIIALITESEAAEIIEDAVASKTSGFTVPTLDATALIETYLNNCGEPGDTSLSKSKSGGVATYNYTFNLDWIVNCSNLGVPQSANVGVAGNGAFTSLHWSGTDNTLGDLDFTGLALQEPAYIVNGTYNLTGNLTGSLRKISPSIDCVVALTLTNLAINKTSNTITGGSGVATVTATSANGESKTLSGELVFNGDGTATVTVNGHEHTFDW